MRAETITAPVKEETPDVDKVVEPERAWIVIVWNDPINLMAYVTYVFQKLFGYGRAKAHKLMMQVHVEGKSVVWNGPKERCEAYVSALHEYGLWATMQKDE
jgi:ATP-dependent Clp protease adaptor protein ClpS